MEPKGGKVSCSRREEKRASSFTWRPEGKSMQSFCPLPTCKASTSSWPLLIPLHSSQNNVEFTTPLTRMITNIRLTPYNQKILRCVGPGGERGVLSILDLHPCWDCVPWPSELGEAWCQDKKYGQVNLRAIQEKCLLRSHLYPHQQQGPRNWPQRLTCSGPESTASTHKVSLTVWRKWRVGRLTVLGRTASTTMMKRSSNWEIRWIDCCSCRGHTCLLSVMALFANLYSTPLSVPQLVWWRPIRSRSRMVNIRKSKLASIMFVILVR